MVAQPGDGARAVFAPDLSFSAPNWHGLRHSYLFSQHLVSSCSLSSWQGNVRHADQSPLVTGQSFVNVNYPQFLATFRAAVDGPAAARLSLAFDRVHTGQFNARVLRLGIRHSFQVWPVGPGRSPEPVAALRDWPDRLGGGVPHHAEGQFGSRSAAGARADPLRHPVGRLGAAGPADCQSRRSALASYVLRADQRGPTTPCCFLIILVTTHARENVRAGHQPDLSAAIAANLRITCGAGEPRHGQERHGGRRVASPGAPAASACSAKTISIAGAALGEAGIRNVRFEPRWLPQAPAPSIPTKEEGRTERATQ